MLGYIQPASTSEKKQVREEPAHIIIKDGTCTPHKNTYLLASLRDPDDASKDKKEEGKTSLSYEDAKRFYKSSNVEMQEEGRTTLRSMALDIECRWRRIVVAKLLFKSAHVDDKMIGKSILLSLVGEVGSVAKILFKHADNEETRNKARKTLYRILENPEKFYQAPSEEIYTDQLLLKIRTALDLIEKGNEQDKHIGEWAIKNARERAFTHEKSKCLRCLALFAFELENCHIEAYSAYEYLLSCGDKDYEYSATRDLEKIAQTKEHIYQYNAAAILYLKSNYSSNVAEEALSYIANRKSHPYQAEAKKMLSGCVLL